MNASVFALLCVAVFASSLRQSEQAFLNIFKDDAEIFANAYLYQAEVIESFFISQLYPDNADQVLAELKECQDQDVELLPTVIKEVVADMDELLQACIKGSVTEAINKIVKDSLMTLKGVSASCPNMPANIGADIDQLSATFTAQTLGIDADEATLQKTGEDTKVALNAIRQAFEAVQAGDLTEDQLAEALNDSLLLVRDSSTALGDAGEVKSAIKIASTSCGFISSIFVLVQDEREGNRQ